MKNEKTKKMKSQAKTYSYFLIIALFPVTLIGCMVGPNFKSPQVNVPDRYLYDSLSGTAQNPAIDSAWWKNFGDPKLDSLIKIAIDSNKNLSIALSRVEQARLKARSARADLAPSLDISGSASWEHTEQAGWTQNYTVQPSISWTLDVFGKLRRMSQSAKADWLASKYGYSATMLSLLSEVATNYFSLLEYKRNLDISRQTYRSREISFAMIDSSFKYGKSSGLDRRQAESQLQTAAAAISQYERAVAQTTLTINSLLGENPHPIETSHSLTIENITIPDIPSGIPASLLKRRPDIMQAYQQAASASAQIGVAVANRFPSFALTGAGGVASEIVKGISSGNPVAWGGKVLITEPLLNWGNNKRAVEIARETYKQTVLQYEQTVINAFSEVEQSLSAIQTYKQQIKKYQALLKTVNDIREMTTQLYAAGSTDYLQVLDAERTYFSTQIQYVQLLSSQLAAYTTLYMALGGGLYE